MIPVYILGILLRFGPQHGYQIQKTIAENVADFTQIKLPTIYYHLEAMARKGLLSANCEYDGARPEKTVYTVTEKGKEAFLAGLGERLSFHYRPVFDMDAIFYFAEYGKPEETVTRLKAYAVELGKSLDVIRKHEAEVRSLLPDAALANAEILFEHHITHYKAERAWVLDAIRKLEGERNAEPGN
jgi:DNA-binding PadR family transcriptional regulator